MKRRYLLFFIIFSLLILSSCNVIEDAVEDTFRQSPQKHNADQELNKPAWKRFINLFIDDSNYEINQIDIVRDAEEKLGFEFTQSMDFHLSKYLRDNDIKRYLSDDEIEQILKDTDKDNLLLSYESINETINKLIEKLGSSEIYVYRGSIRVYPDQIYIEIIDSENISQAEIYYYSMQIGEWTISPTKRELDRDDIEKSVALSEIPFSNIQKITNQGFDVLKEMGEYNEYSNTDPFHGIYTVSGKIDSNDRYVFETQVKGTREEYKLKFDKDGELIEKVRN